MPDLSRGASELDTRLAEIDRKLRAIQVDLDPAREPAPSREPSSEQEAAAPQSAPEPARHAPEPQPSELRSPEPQTHEAPAAKATGAPTPRHDPPRGRSGPLAALLQRSSRQSSRPRQGDQLAQPGPPGEGDTPGEGEQPGASAPSLGSFRPPPASGPKTGMVPPETHAKLLSAMRDLLDAYGWTLQQLPLATDLLRAGESAPVALSVGPFADTAAVHAFEHGLLRISGVTEVVLRGYEGENRAIFDVQIAAPNA